MALKILFWDIEATNLNADFGYVLCVSMKEPGRPTKTYSITDYTLFKEDCTNDRHVVLDAARELSTADIWVTWYGKRFDVPYIQTRLLGHGYSPMPFTTHIDGWETARKGLRLHSNRLASVLSFLELADKTPLNGKIWTRAAAGYHDAIEYVITHCERDVEALEEAYEKLKPYVRYHPNMAVANDLPLPDGAGTLHTYICPRCDTQGQMQKRGVQINRAGAAQRYLCKACGGWSAGPARSTRRGHPR